MNSTPGSPDQPSFFRRYGCLVILVTIAFLFIAGVLTLRYLIADTAMPYRMMASLIEKANPNVHIDGIKGDLGSGFNIGSIRWGDGPESPSEIRDLRLRYNGFTAAGKTHRIVIQEIGVGKAHIDLADFPQVNTATTTTQTTTVNSGSNTTTVTTTTSSGGFTSHTTRSGPDTGVPSLGFPDGLESFEIDRVSIADVLITNRHSDFRLSIPKIDWTGLKATPTTFDPGWLTIESDRLNLHTSPGRTVPMEGRDVTFQKLLTGTAQPALHPALQKPIDFTADISISSQGERQPFHLAALNGQLELNATKDGGGTMHVRQLDLASLVDPKKLFGQESGDMPSDLALNAVATSGYSDGTGTMKIVGGSFRLGTATFQIEPVEFTKAEQEHAVLEAVSKSTAGEIHWALPLGNFGNEFRPRFLKSSLPPNEILAQVFTGKSYGELSADEKKSIDARIPVYFPSTEK